MYYNPYILNLIKYCISLFLLIYVHTSIDAQSNQNEIDDCYQENTRFVGGEKLVYRIYYNWSFIWIPAGEVEFVIEDNGERYAAEVIGRSYKSYESIYVVNDLYRSTIKKDNLLPESFLRDVEEGSYFRYDSILFDQSNRVIESYWGDHKEDAERFDFTIDDCMQDMVSVMYFVRNIDFAQMKKKTHTPVNVFFDKEVYNLGVEYAGVEKKKKIKGMGKCNTLKIIPDLVEGHVFEDNTRMEIWLSNDENRIPLLIESPLVVGSAKAILIEVEGLKYPLSATEYQPSR